MLLKLNKVNLNLFYHVSAQRFYAKAATSTTPAVKSLGKKLGKGATGAKMGAAVEKKVMPVETDPKKLVAYVCGLNYTNEGEPVKIKPDSAYPEWLWNLNTGPPKTLDELDKNTKAYWKKLRSMALRRNLTLLKTKKF